MQSIAIGPLAGRAEQSGWRGRIPAAQVAGGEGPGVEKQERFVGYLGVVSVGVGVAGDGLSTASRRPAAG
jgi:hypothetical protein